MVFGVSFDNQEDNSLFAEKFDFPYKLLCDESRAIGLAYGACDKADAGYASRISYLIGPDGTIVRAYSAVNPSRHPTQVLEDIVAASESNS